MRWLMRDVNKSVHEYGFRVFQYHHEAHQLCFKGSSPGSHIHHWIINQSMLQLNNLALRILQWVDLSRMRQIDRPLTWWWHHLAKFRQVYTITLMGLLAAVASSNKTSWWQDGGCRWRSVKNKRSRGGKRQSKYDCAQGRESVCRWSDETGGP